MKSKIKKSQVEEYQTFLQSDEVRVSQEITSEIFKKMERLLHPRAEVVFLKLLAVHVVFGFLSLSICHQFNMNPFGTHFSLADWFMKMGGHNICMAFCGTLFLGGSILTAGSFLSIEELRVLRSTEFLYLLGLSLGSLVIFAIFGAELAGIFTLFWFVGSLMGGYLASQVVWRLKVLHSV